MHGPHHMPTNLDLLSQTDSSSHFSAPLYLRCPCISVHAGAGMATQAVLNRLERLGQGVLQPQTGLAALAAAMQATSAACFASAPSAVMTINPFSWGRYLTNPQVGQ